MRRTRLLSLPAAAPEALASSTRTVLDPFRNDKLTSWAELQAEFVQTTAENQIGQKIKDNAVLAGVTLFW